MTPAGLPRPQACILSIGTELTTGQIVNRNAAWIADRLQLLGVDVMLHETVPDDRPLILEALDRCARLGSLLFVTGGLGPTQDDFTRQVIAEWLDRELEFHPPSWDHIVDRLNRFGVRIAESNRQQCLFPEGASVLPNPEGTANGFVVSDESMRTWVLPGPPHEVAAVWNGSIEPELRATLQGVEALKLLTWQCLGKSEAELGELTETALAGSGLQIGYRAHRPFVEIKVWCPESRLDQAKSFFERLESTIGPWIFTRMGEDVAPRLLKALQRSEEVEILDSSSGGLLAERLGNLLREGEFSAQAPGITIVTLWEKDSDPSATVEQVLNDADPAVLTLALSGFSSEGEASIALQEGTLRKLENIKSPWKIGPQSRDRARRYLLEMALKLWSDWLQSATH